MTTPSLVKRLEVLEAGSPEVALRRRPQQGELT
jgi:hypothetical protein